MFLRCGMTLTQEVVAPGFWSDVHASGYQLASLSPAPDELNLFDRGLELIEPEYGSVPKRPHASDGGLRRLPLSGGERIPVRVGLLPRAGVFMAPGRNPAQVICGDLGLDFDALVARA